MKDPLPILPPEKIRAIRKKVIGLEVGLLPALLVLAIIFAKSGNKNSAGGMLFLALLTHIGSLLWISVIRCPGCGKKFFFRRFLFIFEIVWPFLKHCFHCGHSLYPPNPPANSK